jgi:hypothetical protein
VPVMLRPGHRGGREHGRLAIRLGARWRAVTGSASAAAIAVGLLACLCTALAVAGPRAGSELHTDALRKLIATAPAANKAVLASTEDGTLSSCWANSSSGGTCEGCRLARQRTTGAA